MQEIKSILKKGKHNFQKYSAQLYYDQGDYRRSVLLAGTGRSGTTWLENIINYNNSYRIMFEPFHSKKNELIINWRYRQYIRPDNKSHKLLYAADRILSGNIRNNWVDRFNKKFIANKRLIKDIRISLFLKWINVNFPEIPIILLIRHPCAVASSKILLEWDDHLDEFMSQDDLVLDYLSPFKNNILKAENKFEKHIYTWCIENYIPLCQFNSNEILLIFYENLCTKFDTEIDKIFSFLNQKYSLEVYNQYKAPSALSRKNSAVQVGDNLIEYWKKYINKQQIKKSQEICSLFGLNAMYDHSSMPLSTEVESLSLFT